MISVLCADDDSAYLDITNRYLDGPNALAITLVSFTFVLSYIYGAPLFHGATIIPIASMSALAALLIGAGQMTAAGPTAIPPTYIPGSSTHSRLLRFFLPLTLIIILVQNFIQVMIVSFYDIHNALILALSVVIFSLITGSVIARVYRGFNHAIDTAELELTNTLLEEEIIHPTQAEENVRKSLNERELLLCEIHHRVKNNLQIILSLISLQSRNIKDQKLLEIMGEFQNRILAMAHIHERICRAEDISRINLSEIVTFLGTSLFKFYKVNPEVIRLNVELKDIWISINSAIPISLIINELISNSIKHGFPNGTPGEITIAGRREADTLVLSIRDTGIGIPEDLDWMRSKQSLGLQLVVSLVQQLNGTIELDRTAGTVFNIVVKEKDSVETTQSLYPPSEVRR